MLDKKNEAREEMEKMAEQIRELKKIQDKWNKEETALKSSRIEVGTRKSFIDDPATILKGLLTKFQLTLSSMPDSQMCP